MEHYAGAYLHKRVTQLALFREGKPPAQFRFRNEKELQKSALEDIQARRLMSIARV